MIPDSVHQVVAEQSFGMQRFVEQGALLQDGTAVLLYSTRDPSPDFLLLHLIDPASGEESRVFAPRGERDESLDWTSFDLSIREQGLVLVGYNYLFRQDAPPNRRGKSVWQADLHGLFTRPPSFVSQEGNLLGTFADGSLVMMTHTTAEDTTMVSGIVSVRAAEDGVAPADRHRPEVLFRIAVPREPGTDSRPYWAPHPAWVTALAGDTIWLLPTDRPELVAVHRSGDVLLKVDWDAGDRTVPPGTPGFRDGTDRLPAAARLVAGADGLLYVRRWELIDGVRPERSLEWLVFTKAGDLVARLDVPPSWRQARFLAFGHDAVLATLRVDGGPTEVRVHAIERPVAEVAPGAKACLD